MSLRRLRDSLIPICLALGFRSLAYVVALSQYLSSSCYDYLSRFCGLPPCGVFRVRESAIVIVGGEAELGGAIALSFSELGYTVFTLHPTLQHLSISEPSSQPVADTSAATNGMNDQLLYSWHKKKERSNIPWGLIAPIALDMTSGADRKRASETVKAYCTNHSLQLVALISLSPPTAQPQSSDEDSSSAQCTASAEPSSPSTHLKPRSTKDFSQALIWGDMVAQSVREPIVMFQDYIDMLSRVSGRIVMVSTSPSAISSNIFPLSSAFDGIQRSVADYLGRQMDFYGIKLCTVSTGPLDGNVRYSQSEAEDPPKSPFAQILDDVLRLVQQATYVPAISDLAESSRLFAVSQDDVSRLLREIVAAEYPKDTYCLGLQPYLSRVSQVIPTPVRLLASSLAMKVFE
ncbi:hypothetical protein EIP91_001035 [Steccherinum ochraceum]|uniref:Ketoreductase (KR) domain-containing protein n=1 Tax=Steccherinum ochraceum TaxID=92696 RepID=A0A4R0RET8_9APHY|nr:hypothetical protein EIP91_001035 [Steccherinum ochraceum]